MMEVLVIKLVLAGIVFFTVLNFAGFHTWVERKQSALIQDRIGANRASILGFRFLGLFHGLADAIKMFSKEDIIPAGANKTLHTLAPSFSVFFALVAFAAIPFGPPLILDDTVIELQVAKIGNIRIVDEVIHCIRRPLQAVFFGEAIFIRGEIWHAVFELVEQRGKQHTDCKPDQDEWNEDSHEPGEDGKFHGLL